MIELIYLFVGLFVLVAAIVLVALWKLSRMAASTQTGVAALQAFALKQDVRDQARADARDKRLSATLEAIQNTTDGLAASAQQRDRARTETREKMDGRQRLRQRFTAQG